MSILLQLFLSFLQIGALSVGGGYAAIPLIQNQIVDNHQWMSMSEFTDLLAIAEMTPGPIAINSATFVGMRVAGFPGAVLASFATILPSMILVSLLAYVYYRYRSLHLMQHVLNSLRPVVVALIASAGLSIFLQIIFILTPWNLQSVNWIAVALFAMAFFALRKWKLHPILVILGTGIVNLGITLLVDWIR